MNYTSTNSIPYFKESAPVVNAAGFQLVELQVVPRNGDIYVTAVIASKDPKKDIGVADCSRAHHALQPKLVSLLGVDEDRIYMEVCSPGMERNFKNAAEFGFFVGRDVRVWDTESSDWVRGVIERSDETQVTLKVEGGEERSFAYENIAKAKFIHL